MRVVADNDWRLDGQEKYLQGAELRLMRWWPHREGRDHDHCQFCWARILDQTKGKDEYDRGYVTVDNRHWICPSCFADFKSRFGWLVLPS